MAAALGRGGILILDDSVTYREYLRLELEGAGARVTTTGRTADALAAVQSGAVDMLVLDLVMPGVDGLEICRKVAALRRERGHGPLLVVLSSRETPSDHMRSLQAGADIFLGKSQDMSLLRTRLGASLRLYFLQGGG